MKKRKYASGGNTWGTVGSVASGVFGELQNAFGNNKSQEDKVLYGDMWADPTQRMLNDFTGNGVKGLINEMNDNINTNIAPLDNNALFDRLSNIKRYDKKSLASNTDVALGLFGNATGLLPLAPGFRYGKGAKNGVFSVDTDNLAASAQGAMSGLSYSGSPWGALVGGVAGGIFNYISDLTQNSKIRKYNKAVDNYNMAQNTIIDQLLNNSNMMKHIFNAYTYKKLGGPLNTHGGNFQNGLFEIVNGGTHEENPYEGVPMGMDQEGNPNLVEEGEWIYDGNLFGEGGYVYSKRLETPDAINEKYKFEKGSTFADAVNKVQRESEERPNDPISKRGLQSALAELAMAQEIVRAQEQQKEINTMANGGGLNRKNDYGSKKKPYPSVDKKDFAGGNRSYPIPTKADAVDALRLAGLHNRPDVKAKVYRKYPELKHAYGGNLFYIGGPQKRKLGDYFSGNYSLNYDPSLNLSVGVPVSSGVPVVQYSPASNVVIPNVGFDTNVPSRVALSAAYDTPYYGLELGSNGNNKQQEPVSAAQYPYSTNIVVPNIDFDNVVPNNVSLSAAYDTPYYGLKLDSNNNNKQKPASTTIKEDKSTKKSVSTVSTISSPSKTHTFTDAELENMLAPRVIGSREDYLRYPERKPFNPTIELESEYVNNDGTLNTTKALQSQSLDALTEGKPLSTWMRYTPIGMAVAALLNNLKPIDYSNADRIGNAARNINKYRSAPRLSNYMEYTPVNKNEVLAELNAQRAADRRAVNDLSNLNPATREAVLTAMTARHGNTLGDTLAKVEEINQARRKAVEQFNSAINSTNAELQMNAAAMNQRAEQMYNEGILKEAMMRHGLEAAQSQAVSDAYNTIAAGLGDVGRENAYMNMMHNIYPFIYDKDWMVRYKAALDKMIDEKTKACGGKLRKVK